MADVYDPEKNEDEALKQPAEPGELADAEAKAGAAKEPAGAKNEAAELGQHENQVGRGYSSGADLSQMRPTPAGIIRFAKANKGKTIAGAGITASIISLIIASFLFFLPLKILHIVNNLQDRFFATAENAVDKEVDRLFSSYIKKKIRLGGCGAVIDSSCNPFNAGDSLVTRLYRGWSNGKLEERMWKQGKGFQIRRSAGGYEIVYNADRNLTANLDGLINGNDTFDDVLRKNGDWSPTTRNEIRQAFRTSMEGETRWKRTMYRIKVGGLLERKFGIKRCIVGCKVRDNFADWKDNKKRAYKMYLSDRVLKPRAQIFTLMVECMLSPGLCDDILNAKPGPYTATTAGCTSSCTDGGEPLSDTERNKIRAELLRVIATQFDSDPTRLRQIYDDIYKNGYSTYIIGSILEKITGVRSRDAGQGELNKGSAYDLVAKRASNAIPILGQIILAAQIVGVVNEVPELVPKLVYIANSTSMVQHYAMYRTHADEIKEGNVDAQIVGTFVDSLGPGDHRVEGEGEEQIGGTAGAEATPLYGTLVGNTQTKTKFSSPIAGIFSSEVSAQTSEYLCKDNISGSEEPVPNGALTCPEFNLRKGTNLDFLNTIKRILGPAWTVLASAAGIINDLVNGVIGVLFSAVGKFLGAICIIPGVCDALEAAVNAAIDSLASALDPYKDTFANALTAFFSKILGINTNLISGDMSGGRSFDLMAGGADISGNEYANHGLGGVVLSEQQIADNLRYHEENKRAEYQQKSFLTRMFDTESDFSPISKLALAVPADKSTALNSVLAKLSNPVDFIAGIFSSIFSSPFANAQPAIQTREDPFGVLQFGYPLDDPALIQDPDEYWNTYCVSDSPEFLTQRWNQFAADNLDKLNSMPTSEPNDFGPASPMGTNRCLLIQAAVGSAGAVFTDDVLTAEEIADGSSSTGGSTSGGGGCTSGIDQSAGTPDVYKDAIAAAAEGLAQPECAQFFQDQITKGTPNDGRQYFASYALWDQNNPTACENLPGGTKYPGRKCIGVKYRNPPQGGNTIPVPIN